MAVLHAPAGGRLLRLSGRRAGVQHGDRHSRHGHRVLSARLVTERLVIAPLRAVDLPAFVAYRRDPRVARYQVWDVGYSMAEAERLLAELAGAGLERVGEGIQLGLTQRADGRLVGDCFSHILADPAGTAERAKGEWIALRRYAVGADAWFPPPPP